MPLIKKVHKTVSNAQVSKPAVDMANVPVDTANTARGDVNTPPIGANWSGAGTKLNWSGVKLRSVHEKSIVIAFNTDIVADMNRKLAFGPGKVAPTDEQEKFLSELSHGGNITLKALAGTGKSTTIRMGIHKLGKPAESRTVHSLGYQVWRQVHSYVQIAEDKVRIILDDFEAQHPQHKGMLFQCGRYNITRIVDILKQCGVGILLKAEPETVLSLIDRYGIDLAHADNYGNSGQPTSEMMFAVEVALAVLKMSTDMDPQVIDFNDQLRAPLVHNVPDYMFPKFRHVFVDEAQDLSELRCAVMSRMVAPDGQIVVVGDSYQSIYGFSGAMTNAMENMTKQFNCNELALTVTHRCPKSVVELANTWVPEYKAAPANADGSVTHVPEAKFRWQDLRPKDAVLCRVNKPLMDLAFKCVANGRGVRVEGRDIGQTIKSYMTKWSTIKTIPALDKRMQEYLADQREKLTAKNREQQAARVEEKVELVRSVLAGCIDNKITRVEDAVKFIDNLFTNGDRDKRELTTFSSVHKAKGREWERVYLLGRNEYMPSKRVLMQGNKEFIKQEDNLQYVAVTRVMQELIEIDVESKKKEGRQRDEDFFSR